MGPYIFWGLKPCFSCLGLSCPYVQWQAWESVRLCFTFISYAKVTNPWSSLQICDELRLLGHLLILILYVCNDCEMMYIFLLLFYLSACWERHFFFQVSVSMMSFALTGTKMSFHQFQGGLLCAVVYVNLMS